MTTTNVTAYVSLTNETLNFEGNVGKALVGVTGSSTDGHVNIFNVDLATMGTASFSVGSYGVLQGTAAKLSGVTVGGHGQVQVTALQGTPAADLSLMTLTSVQATAALADQTVVFTGKLGKAVVNRPGFRGGQLV